MWQSWPMTWKNLTLELIRLTTISLLSTSPCLETGREHKVANPVSSEGLSGKYVHIVKETVKERNT